MMLLEKQNGTRQRVLLWAVFLVLCFKAQAQVLMPDVPDKRTLYLLEDQFRQQHYAVAAQTARAVMAKQSGANDPDRKAVTDFAEYYLTVASIKTAAPGWEDSAIAVMESAMPAPYKQRTAFFLAQKYFHDNKLAKAIPNYEAAGISNLSNEEIADAKFELAYCYFNNKQFDKAEPLFSSIKELKDGKYYKAGNYYYGLLAYNENNYADALASFELIRNDKLYRTVVPYYIAETSYFMGDTAKALHEALAAISPKVEKSYYDNDLHLLIAQCYFEDQKYAEAKPYFEFYYAHTDKIRKEDLYKMGYCDYRLSDWNSAIEKFKTLGNTRDSLGQTSMYLLGDCYIHVSDKPSARNAFGLCADMVFNPGQREAAMMLYSMISYDLGYDDESARQLENLLTVFPHTEYRDEAHTLLSDLLIKTHNYAEALADLKLVAKRDDEYRKAEQKAAYGYAVQLFRKGDYEEADKYFAQSLLHQIYPAYTDAAYFWRGDIAFRLRKYDDAINYSTQFIDRKGDNAATQRLSPQSTGQHAYINMGFAALELQDYNEAQGYFTKAQQAVKGDEGISRLAAVREADAVFLQKNYSKALPLYNKIIGIDTENADYAKFQKCIILGLLNRTNEKIAQLQTLIGAENPSPYEVKARYELALTYIEEDKFAPALAQLAFLTDITAADKSYAAKAYMKTGFIYQQTNDNAKATAAYRKVVTDFPASEERMAALDVLRNMFIQMNTPGEFSKLLRDAKLPSADSNSVDSAFYAAAEVRFASGNWAEAKQAFDNYLAQYPNGIFAVKAHYYRAECAFQLKKYKAALEDYKTVLAEAWNDFSENSARHAAAIAYEQKDYSGALTYYRLLRAGAQDNAAIEYALVGSMKCHYFSGNYDGAGAFADSVLDLQGVSAEGVNDALLFKAKAFYATKQLDECLPIFKQLVSSKNGETAAEARHTLGEVYLASDNLQLAEEAANNCIRESSGYDYWIVKSYITLADILIKQKDYFNARATLESIVKHTKIQELKQQSLEKLNEVNRAEKAKSKLRDE